MQDSKVTKFSKIDILLPDLRVGGAESVGVALAHEFARVGHEVRFVLLRAEGELLNDVLTKFQVVNLNARRIRASVASLTLHLRNSPPHILLSAMWPLTFVAPLAKLLSRQSCKVLASEHGIISEQYASRGSLHHWLLRISVALGYRLADHCVGVSAGVAADMAKLSFLNSNNIETICNPVSSHSNPTDAEIDRVENLWSVPPGARVLSVGRLKPVKNLSLLIRAFSTVSGHNARLMIVGDGDEKETLISLSKSLGIADRVIFVGFQLNPAAFYQTADLFVLSSKYEGFGNVIVEAMASGTSVVSTNCLSGPSEILEDGKYGLLVAVDDVEALGAAMEFSLRNSFKPALLKRRSAEFSPKIAARKYLDLMGL